LNKKLILFIALPIVSIAIIVIGCYFAFLLFNNFQIGEVANRPLYPKRECLQLSEEDFIGTWYAGNPTHGDTLIIQEDGIYKQLIHIFSFRRSFAANEFTRNSMVLRTIRNGIVPTD
jgi:hypothetical protein